MQTPEVKNEKKSFIKQIARFIKQVRALVKEQYVLEKFSRQP